MRQYLIALLMMVSIGAQAQEMQYVQCQVEGKRDGLLMMKSGRTWGAFMEREGSGYVAADSCFAAKDAPEELLQTLSDKKDLAAVCVFVTGDDGSGDAVVIRKGTKPRVEMLFVDVSDVRERPSKVLTCY